MNAKAPWVLGAAFLAVAGPLFCCGPNFPNMMLLDGEDGLRLAPVATFQAEVERMRLAPSSLRASPPEASARHRLQTEQAELDDLGRALRQTSLAPGQQREVVARHQAERSKLFAAGAAGGALRPKAGLSRIDPARRPAIDPRLPAEFTDYFRGCIAWHEGNLPAARAAWETLLDRPESERPWRSTWAAFMLGRSWEEEDRNKARRRFQEVRIQARKGASDSLGLAAASLGYEARLHWRDGRYTEAMDLYLEQMASGDPTALNSLRFCAGAALDLGPGPLKSLARHPRAQALITAHVISGGGGGGLMDADSAFKEALLQAAGKVASVPISWHHLARPVDLWLEAVESAGITNLDAAEKLALAAYQAGDMEGARRWIGRAPAQPAAQWLQAKLDLRDGRIEAAAAILARLARLFPATPDPSGPPPPSGLITNLFMAGFDPSPSWTTAAEQLRAEGAVLQLARRQYVESLDALLRSGYWLDAAYVAERVLTLEELKTYVDQHAPPAPPPEGAGEGPTREDIRYLLARRLARNQRGAEARDYFPMPWRDAFDLFTRRLEWSRDPALSAVQRARFLFQAAKVLREHGLELIGTEVEPDWRVYQGQFTSGVDVATRIAQRAGGLAGPSAEEIDRALAHGVVPNQRFHYRYHAAGLAWEAAQAMPNNDEETARVLCLAGGWLKHRDPQAADKFYKALVNRCGQTPIGAQADRLRWFPPLDAGGNLARGGFAEPR